MPPECLADRPAYGLPLDMIIFFWWCYPLHYC